MGRRENKKSGLFESSSFLTDWRQETWIHHAGGIEGMLELRHQSTFDRAAIRVSDRDLGAAEAVFSREAAAHLHRKGRHGLAEIGRLAVETAMTLRRRQVVVDVTVGEMAERIDANARENIAADPPSGTGG
jgi:hypothetical protein